jgi:hypothetical protein
MRLRMPVQNTQERPRSRGHVIRMKGSARRKGTGREGKKKNRRKTGV